MHSVALEKPFQTMCLDLIESNFDKTKGTRLVFFCENGPFLQLPLRAYNLFWNIQF